MFFSLFLIVFLPIILAFSAHLRGVDSRDGLDSREWERRMYRVQVW